MRIDGQAAGHLAITERRTLGAAFVPEERLGPWRGAAVQALRKRHPDPLFHRAPAAGGLKPLGFLFLRRSITRATAKRIGEAYDVRKGLSPGSGSQRSCPAEICRNSSSAANSIASPRVLVVNQPTWGVDAGAAALIRQALIDLAAAGSAVLVISQDLDEIFEIAVRIAVISHGHLSSRPEARSTDARSSAC